MSTIYLASQIPAIDLFSHTKGSRIGRPFQEICVVRHREGVEAHLLNKSQGC